jgi:flagella basal body P-ring formation protein FlgA
MRSLFYCLACLWCGFPLVAWGTPLTITVQSTAIVTGPQITIGDVAEVSGDSPPTVVKVQGIVIGQSPPAGQERTLYGGYIATRLKQHGLYSPDVQIHTPAKIRVTRASQRIAAKDIEAIVVRAIHTQMPWQTEQMTIRSLRGIEPVILPPGSVHSEVTFPARTDFLGRTSFTVAFRVAGNLEHNLYGTADLEVTTDIVTTARPLARHETITAEDLHVKQVNLAHLPRRILMQPDDVIGKRTKRPLQANALIHAYEVETLPLVHKGDAVLIIVDSPLLKVTTVGEALEPGQRGDTIRVKNVTSQREIRAVVVSKESVKVPF